MNKVRFGICASGKLGYICVSYLLHRGIKPAFLFIDKGSSQLAGLANENNLPLYSGNPRGGKGFSFLSSQKNAIDFILSINYLFLLERDIIHYPRLGCINFHGSLLPKYRGRTPHVWAIINNEIKTGITAHYIDEGCDTGRILLQKEIVIEQNYTGADILAIYEREYPAIIEEVVGLLSTTAPIGTEQDEAKATYFGKRTPDDGMIDWNWQKERIFNWVRAQANPYPGAFSFYEGKKLTIDRIEFSDRGFHHETKNGTVLAGGDAPEIKTPNGAVRLVSYRESVKLDTGKILQ